MARKVGGRWPSVCVFFYCCRMSAVCTCVHVCECVYVHLCACVCANDFFTCLLGECFTAIQQMLRPASYQRSPFWGIKEIGGQLLFGTRLDSKWHPREKFQPLILATQDLHWIKCFLYFHNFYIYMSFSILYSWVIQDKQIELPII